ncbi:MAG: ATP-binding protein [Deltaproteobacteria bacterium]|nr:ATP-binding protein [Deltaproteobacteria bacterium]
MTVGVYENAPKVFTAESGQPAGIFIDIIEHIAKVEGWNQRYVSGTWGEGLDRLAKGEIDLMPDVAFTVDREKTFSFHKVPVLSSWSQVYALKGSGIQSILDLNGKRIAVLERSVQQEVFIRLASGFNVNTTLISMPDYKTMFEMVAGGEADAAITNRFYGLMHGKKIGLEGTAVIFDPSDLVFAATRGDPKQLLDTLDSHLSDLKKDPQSAYYQSLKKWTSEEVRFNLPAWLQFLALVVGVALLTSLAGSFVLKYQVNARTRELKQINLEMEQRIIRRTAELAAAMEAALAADRIKSSFLATMSHELRTPLNSIIGFTGIMLQGLAGPLNPEQQKQMTMVQNSSRHLLALINDVLDISKIEAGQLDLSVASFDLRPSIEKIVRLVSPLAEHKGIDLRANIAPDVGTITTDQRRLEQVILNLLSNAVKFTEKGHVCVACRTENNHYCLSFADTGIGMQPEEIAKLFQPFHQIDSGLTRKHEGTGLGLSICKKIIDMMGGSIGVVSRWGQGSTFTVHIPRQPGGLP